ncbi:hypothetical protein [Lactococcus ileimucosae]|uniref:Uncharacterized protein n=1 Tax=Lactococcus ileimucosae TaxID=2941329 RepID=A0ABV4D2J8_9LACT|nr:hypothetical protein [Lactococcus ileimucosae]
MKRRTLLSCILLFSVCTFIISGCHKFEAPSVNNNPNISSKEQKEELAIKKYRDSLKGFNIISAKDVLNKNTRNIFIYLGRESCPYCREYLPLLSKIKQETKTKIYYIENLDLSDPSLQQILEMNSIDSIPTLLYIKKDGSFEKTGIDSYEQLKNWFNERILK